MCKKNIALYLLTPFLIQWGVSFLVEVLAGIVLDEPAKYMVELSMLIGLIILPIAGYIYKKDKEKWKWESEKTAGVKEYFHTVFLGICSCLALNYLIFALHIQDYSSNYQNVAEHIYQAPIWILLMGTGIVAPVMEEMIYRGLLYRRMRRLAGTATSVIVSSLVFGINHGNLVQFLFAGAMGILLAITYERYKDIRLPVLLHISINLTSIFITWSSQFFMF